MVVNCSIWRCHMKLRTHASAGILLSFFGLWLAMPLRPAFGQTVVSSDILGQMTDRSGAVVADAAVTVTNQNSGFPGSVKSDFSGAYLVPDLHPGIYRVRVA